MGFRYVNPGYPRLFGVNGNVVTMSKYNPINNVSCDSVVNMVIPFPDDSEEIWAQCGMYLYAGYVNDIGIGITTRAGTTGYRDTSDKFYGFTSIYGSQNSYGVVIAGTRTTIADLPKLHDAYHKIQVHSVNGANGLVEIFVDGKRCYLYEGEVSWKQHSVAMRWNDTSGAISNIIISDTKIYPSEEVYIASPQSTDTTMEQNNGVFTASEENQYEQQVVNTSALATKAGMSNLRITGAGVMGLSSYFSGEELTKLAVIRNGVEKGIHSLSTNTKDAFVTAWDEDLTLEELATLNLGLKAKA